MSSGPGVLSAEAIARSDSDRGTPETERARPYAYYALAVLTLANLVNYVDRQIPSILAQSIKADLHLDDAQLGFLLGTAFAVFYAIVGIAMGQIADALSRKWTMAIGLTVWSSMTALGGAATSFVGLAAARIGVGAGEATANPCSNALLSEYFPRRNRAAVLSVYVAGTFIGSALALILGGQFLQHWPQVCRSVPFESACALPSWKAALIAVGLPGLPIALLVAGLREPARPRHRPMPVGQLLLIEAGAAFPPFTLLALYRAGGSRVVLRNLLLVAGLAVGAILLIRLTGDTAQWCAVAIGFYAIFTWGALQRINDKPLHALTFGCPTFVMAMLSSALIACIGGAVNVWAAPYAMRSFDYPPAQIGIALGLTAATSAAIGVIGGGWITDRWKLRDARAPLWIAMISMFGALPSEAVMLFAPTPRGFIIAYFVYGVFNAGWGGAFAALIQDLVLPRMRGTASAVFTLVTIVVAAGAGPYWAGKVSALTGSLRGGLLSVQLLLPFATVLLLMAASRLRKETPAGRRARAEAAGEPDAAAVTFGGPQ